MTVSLSVTRLRPARVSSAEPPGAASQQEVVGLGRETRRCPGNGGKERRAASPAPADPRGWEETVTALSSLR